jgi:hypothetical protein
MVPISPDPAAPAEHLVDRACDANRQGADTARERSPVVGLDDEVDVIVLDTELEDAKARVRGCRERASYSGEHAVRSETPQRLHGA